MNKHLNINFKDNFSNQTISYGGIDYRIESWELDTEEANHIWQ